MNWLKLMKYWREGVVLAAILAAFLYRNELIEEKRQFQEYKIKQQILVEERAKENQKKLDNDKAELKKLNGEKNQILEHLNNVINESVEKDAVIDGQRASIERLREYITASFSGRHRAASPASDGTNADRLSNRDFQRLVRDCTETSLMLKSAKKWVDGACDRPGITCLKGGE